MRSKGEVTRRGIIRAKYWGRRDTAETYKFKVAKAPIDDIGRDRVRLHWKRRLGKRRFVILRLEHEGASALVSALGHDEAEEIIQVDIDLRYKLKLTLERSVDIKVSLATWRQQLWWYLNATDPAVRIPAWLGIWSFAVGLVSILPVYSWLSGIITHVLWFTFG